MFVVVFTSLLAVLLSFFQNRSSKDNHLFEIGFGLLTLIACIHYNYGTDYPNYFYLFNHNYSANSLSSLLAITEKEPGWALLNWILPKPYGFFILVALISLVENYVYYKFIKTYVPQNLLWASVALYVGLISFYLLNFSMLRQGLAIALIVYSFICIEKNKKVLALLVIGIASTIHASSLVFVPFWALSYLKFKNGRPVAIALLIVILFLFLVKGLAGDIFASFAESDYTLSEYAFYQDRIAAENDTLGIGFILNSIKYFVFFYFILFRFNEFTHGEKYLIVLSCIPLCLIPFQLEVTGLIGRIGTYFTACQIVTIPITYSKIKTPLLRVLIIVVLFFMSLRAYYTFFADSWASELYNIPFRTILEVF